MCKNIFTIKEVEVILGKTTKSVKHLFKTKRLNYFRENGKVRVSEDALNSFFTLVGQEPLKNQMMANQQNAA
jgi:hypothetical protein